MSISLFFIIPTLLISFLAFQNRVLFDKLKFNAYFIVNTKEWYRAFSYGLVHANWVHLGINMFVLYSFGRAVEYAFHFYFDTKAIFYFIFLYISSLAFSVLPDINKFKNDPTYNAIGASGAVSAVLFSSILFFPKNKIYLMFFPIGIPSYIFGIIYMVYSYYMSRKQIDNIGHLTHFAGAVYGFVFPIILKPELFLIFIEQLIGRFYI